MLLEATRPVARVLARHCSRLYYSGKHEWVGVEGDTARVGITQYAADALGDLVYAELPQPGQQVEPGAECGAMESVKAASELFSPVGGRVVETNTAVESKPGLVNSSAETEGWLFRLELGRPEQLDSLMDRQQYQRFLQSVTDDLE